MPRTPPGDGPAVEVDQLEVRFRRRGAGDVVAVDGLTFVAERGAVTAVLGPNGAGKTTTVETCEGYRRPARGSVRVLGLDPVGDAVQLRPRVGVMLQEGGVPGGVRPHEALAHADAATAILLHLQARAGTDGAPGGLVPAVEDHAAVQQATGIVSVQADVTITEALGLLRARAFASDRSIVALSRDVVAGLVHFTNGGGEIDNG